LHADGSAIFNGQIKASSYNDSSNNQINPLGTLCGLYVPPEGGYNGISIPCGSDSTGPGPSLGRSCPNGYEDTAFGKGILTADDLETCVYVGGNNSGQNNPGGGGWVPVSGSGCFAAGTKVAMANGASENIENIQAGDQIVGYQNGQNVIETVLKTEQPVKSYYYKVTLANGVALQLSDSHPLYTQDGWASISPSSTAKEDPGAYVKSLKTSRWVTIC